MDTSVFTQFIGELIGTMILVLLGDGVVAAVSLKKSKMTPPNTKQAKVILSGGKMLLKLLKKLII